MPPENDTPQQQPQQDQTGTAALGRPPQQQPQQDPKAPVAPRPKSKTRVALEAFYAHHLSTRRHGDKKLTIEEYAAKHAPNLRD